MNFINEETTADEMDGAIYDAIREPGPRKALIAHARKTNQKPSEIANNLQDQLRIALADDKSLTNFSQFKQKAKELVDVAVKNNFPVPGKPSKPTTKAVAKPAATDKNTSPMATKLLRNLRRNDKWDADGEEYTARLVDKEGKVVYQGSAKGPIELSQPKASSNMYASMPSISDLNESSNILNEYILKNTGEKFEETPFGQIVADEINKAVAEIPEIKVALEYLSEQEDAELEASTKELGKSYATAALNRARDEMIEKLPEVVSQLVEDLMDEMGSSE
tara:strand:+ start:474 stop:1307 length:834 start_codon:yes stop_codon:yes gene_type:complete